MTKDSIWLASVGEELCKIGNYASILGYLYLLVNSEQEVELKHSLGSRVGMDNLD